MFLCVSSWYRVYQWDGENTGYIGEFFRKRLAVWIIFQLGSEISLCLLLFRRPETDQTNTGNSGFDIPKISANSVQTVQIPEPEPWPFHNKLVYHFFLWVFIDLYLISLFEIEFIKRLFDCLLLDGELFIIKTSIGILKFFELDLKFCTLDDVLLFFRQTK